MKMEPRVFKEIGSLIFFNCFTTTPAIKPAAMPPRKPAPMEFARYAPIIPGARPGLSAIEYAM